MMQFVRSSNIDLWSGRLQEGEIVIREGGPKTRVRRFVDWFF